jgi:hypothetical protein
MARMGKFAGPSEAYGPPLSYIHPVDNDFAKAKFHPSLLDPRLKITNKQRRELQRELDDLAGLLALGRSKVGGR